jgi:hypothetical protein
MPEDLEARMAFLFGLSGLWKVDDELDSSRSDAAEILTECLNHSY